MKKNKVPINEFNKYYPEGRGIIGSIINRYRANKPVLVLANGEPGSGKSYGVLRAIELFYDKTNMNKEIEDWHIVRSKKELAVAIDKAERGTQLIVEEASVLFNSRRSQSGDNVGFNSILDIFRAKYIGLWLTFPLSNAVDSHARKMASHQIVFDKIYNYGDKENGFSLPTIYRLQYNESLDKLYRHYPKVLTLFKGRKRIKRIKQSWFGLPKSAGIIKRYEDLKMDFIRTKLKNEIAKSEEKEAKLKHKMEIKNSKKEKKKDETKKIIKLHKQGKTYREILQEVDVSIATISKRINEAKEKEKKKNE